ncbi:MAG TPA: hypothetical protein VL025_04545 [Thermoanaerobaculia bacterium]|nr:hypothetical protein [Thermoanaerobaculia bacterium]
MAFRFKDLMIQVVPQGGGEDDPACTLASKEPDPAGIVPCTLASKIEPEGLAKGGACDGASEAQCTCTLATKQEPAMIACTLASRIIPRLPGAEGTAALGTITTVTTVTTVTTLVQGGAGGGGSLASLKAQLRAALEDVERQERAQEEPSLPATVEEADDLERRLQEAIEELRDHRKTLQKPAKAETRTSPKGGGKKGRGRK